MGELDKAYADIRIRILKGNWPFKAKNVRNRALIDYKPGSRAESLAVNIWLKKDINLERGHVQLAERYEKQAQSAEGIRRIQSSDIHHAV